MFFLDHLLEMQKSVEVSLLCHHDTFGGIFLQQYTLAKSMNVITKAMKKITKTANVIVKMMNATADNEQDQKKNKYI